MLSDLLKENTKPLTIRATGSGVQQINILPPKMTSSLHLYISYNSIKDLTNIGQFKNLESLLMDFNEISRIEDLEPLSQLKRLTVLHLEGNPVCDLPLWDFYVLKLCPKLRILNGKKVKEYPYTRSQMTHYMEIESKFYQFLITAKFVLKVIKLKLINPQIEISVGTKLIQKSMFKDPQYQEKFADRMRISGAKSSMDGYFCLLRRKTIHSQQKINELATKAQIVTSVHTFLVNQF